MVALNNKKVDGVDDAESIAEMRVRHLRLGMRMQAIATKAIEELEKKVKAGQPLGLSAEDARRLLDAGVELEQRALGRKEPDDVSDPKPN
jgi:hypothetical protein